ncbi:MAG: alpha-N-acetylglucosaminidase C-terminal domain-containing protein [Akkermansia sp.]|nr:alpha-N-acetylglucosaminidase C-terminal domain-containing protein [Akkermansia sp.]
MHHRTFTAFLAATSAIPALVAASVPAQAETTPAMELVHRVTPEYADKVEFCLQKESSQPTISTRNGKLLITASSVLECIRAYGYYLRKLAHVHLSWNGDNLRTAAFTLPEEPVQVPEALPINYAYNYCTLSYTGTHWSLQRWEQELDRLALSGYTHVLVTAGLERVWQLFLQNIGYPISKISGFIPNPAYAAWWNMGNLEGEGGPVSGVIIRHEARLGRFLVRRLRELGMEPVLQGYVGFLPHDMPAGRIRGRIIPQGKWCGHYNRPAILQPTAEDFPRLAALWYKNLRKVYGYQGKYFGGDLFHEGGSTGGTPLTPAAQAVQSAMQKASPGSVWLIQAWGHNPHRDLLAGTDKNHTLILALDKDMTPRHNISRNYQGRPHIWCELPNFGGNHGLYGGVELLENMKGYPGGAVGIGLLSEGLETNPLYYALLTERLNTREQIDRDDFLKEYIRNRYGVSSRSIKRALNLLMESVYSPIRLQEGCQESILCARPSLTASKASTWSNAGDYYKHGHVLKAARLMLQAGKDHKLDKLDTYRYDLADLCRQVLADRARVQLPKVNEAYQEKDLTAFRRESEAFLQIIRDTAEVLATSEHFLLGKYLEGAESKGGNSPTARRQMRNALLQLITTWTPTNGMLNDYAHRQLSELMSEYYLKRWEAFFCVKEAELMGQTLQGEGGRSATQTTENNGEAVSTSYELSKSVDTVEQNFRKRKLNLLTSPQGNVMDIAEKILK